MNKTVIVLGGGVGGLIVATELRKQLSKEHRVVVIDREQNHLFAPSLLWLMVGMRQAKDIQRPLERLARKGIEVRRGEIQKLDPERRAVTVDGEEIVGDYLVVALGAELAGQTIPGLAEAGHDFYTLAGAESLHAALGKAERGRVVVLTAAPAYKCPAAPYEAALLIAAHFASRGLRDAVSVEVWAAEPGPMGVAGPEVSAAVKQLLAAENIPYHPEHQVTAADPAAKTLRFANGAETTFDLLAYVPPHRAPQVVRESPLLGDAGWVSVDRHTLATRFPGVFALGDVTTIPLAMGKPLPKAGVFAHGQAEVVAKNIASEIAGRPADERYGGHGECFIEVGNGKAGFGAGNFYAEPKPEVKLHPPAWRWHAGKVLFEKTWLHMKI
ncbi:MAG: NAD(P)/FAD-dependent oxidoreductase [Myxococcales bacterium]|nr:NAD(P)/FAD-dependent oxidoreductase [Myxococcales bacterium]